jgi:hypothetical protein
MRRHYDRGTEDSLETFNSVTGARQRQCQLELCGEYMQLSSVEIVRLNLECTGLELELVYYQMWLGSSADATKSSEELRAPPNFKLRISGGIHSNCSQIPTTYKEPSLHPSSIIGTLLFNYM